MKIIDITVSVGKPIELTHRLNQNDLSFTYLQKEYTLSKTNITSVTRLQSGLGKSDNDLIKINFKEGTPELYIGRWNGGNSW